MQNKKGQNVNENIFLKELMKSKIFIGWYIFAILLASVLRTCTSWEILSFKKKYLYLVVFMLGIFPVLIIFIRACIKNVKKSKAKNKWIMLLLPTLLFGLGLMLYSVCYLGIEMKYALMIVPGLVLPLFYAIGGSL